ncbi:MAG: hypothetical protein K5686_13225 [Lachnospiraceae bacterium]|nr:hypothetical protein [Lachnospiraceae bacterium]
MILKTKDDLSLKKIADSGQCFRWKKLEDGAYFVPYKERSLIINELGSGEYELDCSEDEYKHLWSDYLDMDVNYAKIRALADKKSDPFMYEAASAQRGIRILRQDPFEALISFIISQNRNIPAIKNSIELICERAGKTYKDSRGNVWYSFPDASELNGMSDDALKECRLGYRFEYIRRTAAAVSCGEFDLRELRLLDDETCLAKLQSLHGVGLKVASCMLLYGLHRMDAFPVDVWVKRILTDKYPDGFPFEAYTPYCGLFQQYMFAYYRNTSGTDKE